jgi:hypothetical protein
MASRLIVDSTPVARDSAEGGILSNQGWAEVGASPDTSL